MAQDSQRTASGLLDPEQWAAAHGDVLFRYAVARVRDAAVAEDLGQDTLLAAWKARQGFAGQSAEHSWLIGILKHKIVDYILRELDGTAGERRAWRRHHILCRLCRRYDRQLRALHNPLRRHPATHTPPIRGLSPTARERLTHARRS